MPSCAEGGVLGVLPGHYWKLQANEAIKVITGIGEPLSGKLFYTFDALVKDRTFNIGKDKTNPLTGENPTQTTLIDYEQFCGILTYEASKVKEITVQELKNWMVQEKDFQLIDVREPHEYDIVNLGAELIPLKTVVNNANKFNKNKPVVVYCKMGGRSAIAIQQLQEKGFDNLLNLKGGITAYAKEIDPSLITY
ncbi:MAG: rhodanese-like domain-containing protein [Chitinophagales bacterium]